MHAETVERRKQKKIRTKTPSLAKDNFESRQGEGESSPSPDDPIGTPAPHPNANYNTDVAQATVASKKSSLEVLKNSKNSWTESTKMTSRSF